MSNEFTIGNVTSHCVFLHFLKLFFCSASVNPDGGKRLFMEFRQNTGKTEKKGKGSFSLEEAAKLPISKILYFVQ